MSVKKKCIVISAMLIILNCCNCQWYQKYYGVNDPGLLSDEQLDAALKRSKDGIAAGTTISIIGGVGILSGMILFLKDYPYEQYPDQAAMGKKFGGAALALVSIPFEILGLIVLNKNQVRKSEIEKFTQSKNIEIGLTILERIEY